MTNRPMFSRDTMLRHHLAYNHYPPIHSSFFPVAEQAIDNAEAGLWDDEICLPNGKNLTVRQIVEELHLDDFIIDTEDDRT